MPDSLFGPAPSDSRALYLDLMKRVLINWIYAEAEPRTTETGVFDFREQGEGRNWPKYAHTMVGLARLNNIQELVETVIRAGIPGDFVETGVWRGGASIFMRAILRAYGVTDRRVWLFDSFAGLPPSNPEKYPHDRAIDLSGVPELAVPLHEVRKNFERYGLLDDQVRFVKGWFRDTLPNAEVRRIAVLRLDGDLYESTMDALTALYARVVHGGFVIIDDHSLVPTQRAVADFRASRGITEPITTIDWTGVYWRKAF